VEGTILRRTDEDLKPRLHLLQPEHPLVILYFYYLRVFLAPSCKRTVWVVGVLTQGGSNPEKRNWRSYGWVPMAIPIAQFLLPIFSSLSYA
jgi:hypothetical protein